MVSSISGYSNSYTPLYSAVSTNAVLHQNDMENLVRFINGQPMSFDNKMTIGQEVKSTLPFMALFGGIEAYSTFRNNGYVGAEKEAFKAARKAKTVEGWKFAETLNRVKSRYNYTRSEAIKSGIDRVTKDYGNLFTKTTVAEPTGTFGKLMDKIPGYKTLRSSGFGQALKKSGAGMMMAIDGGVELLTNVVPTFSQLGVGAGLKQLGKSTVKVAAGTAGWLGGDAAGKAIGSAIGTLICPGIGTAIGGFIGGFLGGMVGCSLAGRLTKKVVGPSELEKHQKEQTQQYAQMLEQDPQAKLQAAQLAYQQAEEILAQDPTNKDALAAKEAALKILSEAQQTAPAAQTAVQQQTAAVPQQQFVSFAGIPTVPGFNGMGYDMTQYSNQVTSAQAMPVPNFQNNGYNTQLNSNSLSNGYNAQLNPNFFIK